MTAIAPLGPMIDELPAARRTFIQEVLLQIRTIPILYKTKEGKDYVYANDIIVRLTESYPCGCRPTPDKSRNWRVTSEGKLWHLGCKSSRPVVVSLPTDTAEMLRLAGLPCVRRPKQKSTRWIDLRPYLSN